MHRTYVAATLLALACASTARATGNGWPQKGPQFQEHKQRLLADLDSRLKNLQAFRTCVADAQDQGTLKACHQQKERAARAARGAEIDARIQQLQEEKSRLEQEREP